MNNFVRLILLATVVSAALAAASGCSAPATNGTAPSDKKPAASSPQAIEDMQNLVYSMDSVFDKHNVQKMSGWSDADTVYLEVRQRHNHREKLSDDELEQLKQDIYSMAGATFKLDIQQFILQEQPNMRGHIEDIDEAGKRLLIVDTSHMIDTAKTMPDAAWYSIEENDTRLVQSGSDVPLVLADMKIGQTVDVWGNGLMLTSYPGQTSALELVVVKSEENSHDLEGTITAIEPLQNQPNTFKLTLGKQVVYLSDRSMAAIGNPKNSEAELRVGDKVRLWLLSFHSGDQSRTATQVERME